MASFLNDFKNVTRDTDLLLQWDPIDTASYPLQLQALFLNKTSEHGVNVEEVIIATGLTENSYLWRDLPSPLPWLSTASYQLQVRSQEQQNGPVVVSSHQFIISTRDGSTGAGGNGSSSGGGASNNTTPSVPTSSSPKPSVSTATPHSSGHHDSSAAIAAGLVVPIVVGIAVSVFIWMQKRQSRILEERRKAREELVIV